MRMFMTTVALFFAVTFLPQAGALAKENQQQIKMKACQEEVGKLELQGEERDKFMADCLAAKTGDSERKLTVQQEKMRECNREARDKNLKGEERRKFMSGCLKG